MTTEEKRRIKTNSDVITDSEMRQKYPHIEWRAMSGMRDRLIHV